MSLTPPAAACCLKDVSAHPCAFLDVSFIGISGGAFIPQALVLCRMELEGLLLCSGPYLEPCRLAWGVQPLFPAIPSLASTPVTVPPPIRLDPPLQKILFLGPGARTQVLRGEGGVGFKATCPDYHTPRWGSRQRQLGWLGWVSYAGAPPGGVAGPLAQTFSWCVSG